MPILRSFFIHHLNLWLESNYPNHGISLKANNDAYDFYENEFSKRINALNKQEDLPDIDSCDEVILSGLMAATLETVLGEHDREIYRSIGSRLYFMLFHAVLDLIEEDRLESVSSQLARCTYLAENSI